MSIGILHLTSVPKPTRGQAAVVQPVVGRTAPRQERNSKYMILVTFNIYNVVKENYKYKKDTNQSLENKIITYNTEYPSAVRHTALSKN